MAAELGDIAPRSYIGQPLAADIELLSLSPEEVAQGLQVRLALADVYRGANVMMNPALATVKLAVEKRGARSVLHVTTSRPVEADYIHVFVEMGVPGKQQVRLATVWLQPDPNPAPPPPPPVPLATSMTPAQAEQIAAQARATRVEAAAKAARPAVAAVAAAAPAVAEPAAVPVRDRSKPAPLPSLHEAETGAPGEVRAAGQLRRIAGVLVTPDGKPVKPSAREESAAEVPMQVSQALLPLAPLPLPKGVKRPAPASCPTGGVSAKECVALDNHNTEIAGKISELEAKLKALQGALGAAPAATRPAAGKEAKAAGAMPAASAALASVAPPAGASAHGTAGSGGTQGGAMAGGAAAGGAAAGGAAAGASAGGAGAANAAASHGGAASAAGDAHVAAAGHGEAGAKATTALGGSKAELKAQADEQMRAALAEAKGASSSAAASAGAEAGTVASAAASVPPGPTKQVRVLPKLKYKKEKPAEQASDNTLPLVAGAVGALALLGAGLLWWRSKKGGSRGPLKIWQGFRKKSQPAPAPEDEEFKPVNDSAKEPVAQ